MGECRFYPVHEQMRGLKTAFPGRRIFQFIPNLLKGDGTADHCLAMHRLLQMSGYESRIFAGWAHPEVAGSVSPLADLEVPDLLLFHFGGPLDLLREALDLPCRRGMVYHNVTPAHFFAPYDPQAAEMCRRGREILPALRDSFAFALADSGFNQRELAGYGYRRVQSMPFAIDWRKYGPPPAAVREGEELQLLFVGRVVPNKKVEDLLAVVARLRLARRGKVRLHVVGYDDPQGAYGSHLRRRATELGVAHLVHFTGRVDRETLFAHYRRATLFLTLSEHEGFCVPILESMYFGLPVVAYAAGAVPETVGDAGILLTAKTPAAAVAAAVELVADGPELRRELVSRGRLRAAECALEQVAPRLLATLREEIEEARRPT